MRRCVCPGSYDPITNGHLDVVLRSAELFDEVIVAVAVNPAKRGTFAPEQRLELIEKSLDEAVADDGSGVIAERRARVRAETTTGQLLVDFCRQVGAVAVVKGLRSETDYAYELPMAQMNRHLTGVETVFLPGAPGLGHVSSSLVKEVFSLGGDISALVPTAVLAALRGSGLESGPAHG